MRLIGLGLNKLMQVLEISMMKCVEEEREREREREGGRTHMQGFSIVYLHVQGSPHTGREWSAPTTTQPFLPPVRLVLPPLTEYKKC